MIQRSVVIAFLGEGVVRQTRQAFTSGGSSRTPRSFQQDGNVWRGKVARDGKEIAVEVVEVADVTGVRDADWVVVAGMDMPARASLALLGPGARIGKLPEGINGSHVMALVPGESDPTRAANILAAAIIDPEKTSVRRLRPQRPWPRHQTSQRPLLEASLIHQLVGSSARMSNGARPAHLP